MPRALVDARSALGGAATAVAVAKLVIRTFGKEAGALQLDGRELPGEVQRLSVRTGREIERVQAEGHSGSTKLDHGERDAEIELEVLLSPVYRLPAGGPALREAQPADAQLRRWYDAFSARREGALTAHKYFVTNRVLNAMGINEVLFSEPFDVEEAAGSEDITLRVGFVSFGSAAFLEELDADPLVTEGPPDPRATRPSSTAVVDAAQPVEPGDL